MSAFNYPSPSGEYKVYVNKKAPWQHYNTARLQISVGKPRYEGTKFFALVEWCKHRFEHVELIVSDTLQRHNYRWQLDCDPASAWKLARRDGEQWLKKNAAIINHLPSHSITMWDDLIGDGFTPYPSNGSLNIVLDNTIQDFAARQSISNEVYGMFYQHSKSFLLEELGVFRDLFEAPAIDIYAGRWFEELMSELFPEKHYLSVDFIKNKSIKNSV